MNQSLPAEILSYFSEIAERLWTGHASIMVGAGFSKNAINVINPSKKSPNWWELGDSFYEKIYGVKPKEEVRYASLLKLAEEYESAYGRSALESFITKNIADNEYEPSDLHRQLMELPWTDVFTTNYDTLLERSCKDVISRRYDVVINKNDLVYSNKPRIVKLHGSLPSERPFIITEEDYRIYPKKYAPFVNTVQQSLIENTLCLIGFSGDDPNFLQWIGWINDNIGKNNASKIYLVGVLNLSETQKKLLYNKNIIPIDLSLCKEVEGNHQKGLNIFINFLASKKQKRENLDWPLSKDLRTMNIDREHTDYNSLISEWQNCRVKYPNWVVLPQEKRDRLWLFTEFHSSNTSAFEHLCNFDDLAYAYELNWRLEKCLFPIWNNMVTSFQKIIDKYNFFSNELFEDTTVVVEKTQKGYNKYLRYWISLSLALLRFYREEYFDTEWNKIFSRMDAVKDILSVEQQSSFYYEQILQALFKLNYNKVKVLLDEWPQKDIPILWNSKRAMLLSEVGQLKEARNILEAALLEVRKKLNLSPIEDDYTWVSLEAYLMYQLKIIRDNLKWGKNVTAVKDETYNENYNERWNDLLQFHCDPWGEQKYFDTILQQPYTPYRNTIYKNEFEIGRTTRSFTMGGVPKESIIAYMFLRYLEELAIPLSLSYMNIDDKTTNGVLERIRYMSPKWGIAISNRSRDEKVVDTIFGREQLQQFPISLIDSYIHEYIRQFYELLPEKTSNPIAKSFINKVPFILSRLCTKCSEQSKLKIFQFYKDLCVKQLDLPKSDKLIRNVVDSSNQVVLAEAANILIDTPILNPDWRISYNLIEPFDYLNASKIHIKMKLGKNAFDFLIEKAKDSSKIRENAIKRLMFLYDTKQLNKSQCTKMSKAIWNTIDEVSGLPKFTNYFHFAYIKWPQPKEVNTEMIYRKYINDNHFNIQGLREEKGISMSRGNDSYAKELLYGSQTINKPNGIVWSPKELEKILNQCEEWWNLDKHYLLDKKYKDERFGGSIYDEFLARYTNLADILTRVLGFRKKDLNANLISKIETLTKEMESYGVPMLRVKIAFGFFSSKEEYYTQLRIGIQSSQRRSLLDALESTILLIHNSPYQNNSVFIDDTLAVLVSPLQWHIIYLMGDIFDVFKDYFTHSNLDLSIFKDDLNAALDFILTLNIEEQKVSLDEYLLLKQHAIALAGTIYRQNEAHNISSNSVIIRWEEISESVEEFDDIKNRWN